MLPPRGWAPVGLLSRRGWARVGPSFWIAQDGATPRCELLGKLGRGGQGRSKGCPPSIPTALLHPPDRRRNGEGRVHSESRQYNFSIPYSASGCFAGWASAKAGMA